MNEALQSRVWAKLRECMRKIHTHYGVVLNEPTVDFNLTGRVGGWANSYTNQISFNGALLVQHVEDYIARTVPHELAHLATDKIYGQEYTPRRPKKEPKRIIHGARWMEVMAVLGVEPSRCHEYDTSQTHKPKTKYEYICPNCQKSHVFGPKAHSNQQVRPRFYCTACGLVEPIYEEMLLKFKQELGRVNYVQAKEVAAGTREKGPEAKFKLKMKAPKQGTKMAACWSWYLAYVGQPDYDRNMFINIFVNECGCTSAGAATYYANCKKLYENDVY